MQPRPRRALAARAALLALLLAPAAAQTMLPYGTADCLKPAISALDGYALNPAAFRITTAPGGFDAAAYSVAVLASVSDSGGGGLQTLSAPAGEASDEPPSILDTYAPYWRAAGRDAVPPPAIVRAPPGQGLAAAAAVTGAIASVRASATLSGGAMAAAVAPATVTVRGLFSITYYGTWKVVVNLVVGEVYVLYQCGTPNPVSAGVVLPPGAKVFQIPLRSVAVPDTTALAFMSTLKLQDRVVAAPSFSTDSCGQFVARTCSFKSDPDWGNGGKLPAAVQAASVAVLNVARDASDPKAIAVSSAATPPVLRPQWLKFVGAFFNRDGLASGNADTQARNYARKRLRVASALNGNRPKVLWMSAFDRFTDWGYPTGGVQYVISAAAYKRNYISDAGGALLSNNYLLSSYPAVAEKELWSPAGPFQDVAIVKDRNPTLAKQALLNIMQQANIIIDETYFPQPVNAPNLLMLQERYELTAADIATIPAYRNKQVYTLGKRLSQDGQGTDWYEGANVETFRVLDDFVRAITPAIAEPRKPFKWLRRLDGIEQIDYVNPKSCPFVKTCSNRRPASTCPNAYYACSDGTLTYGYRSYHCNPGRCTRGPTCKCCASGISASCRNTCARANRANCPQG